MFLSRRLPLALPLWILVALHSQNAQSQTLATMTAPANGATNVDPSAAFSWNGVSGAQAEGIFRREITPEFAAQAFYGSVEQVLTGWIFDSVPVGEADLEQAKTLIVETICSGLERSEFD